MTVATDSLATYPAKRFSAAIAGHLVASILLENWNFAIRTLTGHRAHVVLHECHSLIDITVVFVILLSTFEARCLVANGANGSSLAAAPRPLNRIATVRCRAPLESA